MNFESWRKSDFTSSSSISRSGLSLSLSLAYECERRGGLLVRRDPPSSKAMARSVDTPSSKRVISSVFATPPASMERKRAPDRVPVDPRIPPPQFPTPEATPNSLSPPSSSSRSQKPAGAKLSLDEGEDVVCGLFTGGYRLLLDQILDYLEPQDLYK